MTIDNMNNLEELLRNLDRKIDQAIAVGNENRAILNRMAESMKLNVKEASPSQLTDESGNLKKYLDEELVRLKSEIEGAEKIDAELLIELAETGDDNETKKLSVLLRSNRENLKELVSRYDYTMREKDSLKVKAALNSIEKIRTEIEMSRKEMSYLMNEIDVTKQKKSKETNEIACALLEERIITMSENLDHLKSRYQELVAEQQELSKSE